VNAEFWMPVLVLATSLVTAVLIFPLRNDQVALRTALNLSGAVLKLAIVLVMVFETLRGTVYQTRVAFLPGLDLVLRFEGISLLFATLSTVLWLLTTIYAVGYLEGSPNRSRFFGFFSLCVTATMGVAMAGNLVTFVIFYELLTLTTYPLVVHRGTRAAVRAGGVYLRYTLAGGAVLFAAVVWLHAMAGPFDFVRGGALNHLLETHRTALTVIFGILVAALGVKAAIVPLHGWLPVAMIAPAPVSALLHAVAVVKAGVFGIVLVVYDVYGLHQVADLGAALPLTIVAAVTIVYGSMRALAQDELKRRLAYSTVSQLSYIVLGVSIVEPLSTTGGLVHLIHQGLMKITLFFAAGCVAETLDIHHVREMDGVGRRMPLAMAAFTVGAIGMIGLPPTAGFVSKWYLGLGALDGGLPWVVPVLIASSLLNAAYFLPIVYRAWFREPRTPWPTPAACRRPETAAALLLPTLVTAALSLLAGLTASHPGAPLWLSKWIVERM
jgi:multicomponent Na+:H+ antiporter subunit D